MPFECPTDSFLPQRDRELLRLELYMAERINYERRAFGLSTLASHALLAAVARAHSAEMRDLGYFAYGSPTPQFRTPSDRYKYAFGVSARYLSENVSCKFIQGRERLPRWLENGLEGAMRPTQEDVEESHQGLMTSPGHRANILEPSLDITVVGIVNRGREFWVTQMFSWR